MAGTAVVERNRRMYRPGGIGCNVGMAIAADLSLILLKQLADCRRMGRMAIVAICRFYRRMRILQRGPRRLISVTVGTRITGRYSFGKSHFSGSIGQAVTGIAAPL